VGRDKVGKFVIDVVQHLAAQTVEVDAARAQNGNRVLILGERQQQMFECGIFVPTLIGVGESPMQRLFEIA
jgi:NADPH-dependent ferric siderophore reductase